MLRVDVVCALFVHGPHILLGKRAAHLLRPELWECPGGKVEAGETHQTALRRELREELRVRSELEVGVLPVASAELYVEVDVRLLLYRVEFKDPADAALLQSAPWRFASGNSHSEIGWWKPETAITRLPCVPSMYAFYRDILHEVKL